MSKYFIGTVRYEKVMEDGKIKNVTELYLVDALSFTECEKKIIAEIQQHISGFFEVVSEKRTNIDKLYNYQGKGEDKFYSCKVNFISIDEKTGKEKKQALNYMIIADSIDKAKREIELELGNTILDYELAKIAETNILDVIV